MAGRLFPDRHLPAEGEVDLRTPIGAFGRYDLLERLGEGRDSEVFVARSDGFEGLFRLNALKRLKPELCSDVATVSRFIEEARLAVRVEHPGTIGVDDFGRVGGVYYIAYEMLDGINCAELLRLLHARRVALDPRAAAFIVRAAAMALDHVHRQRTTAAGGAGATLGLAHGAIEPRSVWITKAARVKLRGFVAPSVFVSPAHRDEVLGLSGIAALAPEIVMGAPPSACADVWSLGAFLWELVTGRRLFAGETEAAVRAAVLDAVIPDPAEMAVGIPVQLLDVIEGALQRDTRARTADARALAAQLSDVLEAAAYDAAAFARTLADLDAEDTRGPAAAREPTRVERVSASTSRQRPAPVVLPPASSAVAQRLTKDPGTWGLVRFAERTVNEGKADEAKAMFRTAAVLFASRGQLAQALCAYDGARALSAAADVTDDLRRLAELGGAGFTDRQHELARVGGLLYYDALRAQTEGGVDRGAAIPTPFLSALGPEAFARLALASRVRRISAGRHVLREGEPGDSLFAVGEGRLVVTCTPSAIDPVDAEPGSDWVDEPTDPGLGVRKSGVIARDGLASELDKLDDPQQELLVVDEGLTRVFLSALTAGDIFGEFSFLTGRPRSASVEAVTSCRLVEIARQAVSPLLEENATLRDAIEAFYKERVLEWMLAKNEVFSLLEPERRRQLLSQCGVYDIPQGKTIVREGELHDAMYFIKRGEVEVTLDDAGTQVFINKLGPGEFFGEIAALEGGPRRATVRAVTDLEAFRITRADLADVLDDAPEVRARLEWAMRQRSAEIRRRIAEQRRVLGST